MCNSGGGNPLTPLPKREGVLSDFGDSGGGFWGSGGGFQPKTHSGGGISGGGFETSNYTLAVTI